MNKIKVLIEGYAKINPNNTWDATSTTTLIDTGRKKIIMDPGCNRQLLLNSLHEVNLKTADIDYVFLSHYHPDHCLLAGIFEKAIIFDAVQWQNGPVGGETGDRLPETDILIIKTPGHTLDHASLLVETDEGKVLIAADVFWWGQGESQEISLDKEDEFASDMGMIKESRKRALELADWIVPGHGKKFRTNK